MVTTIAILVWAAATAYLFYLNRDNHAENSKALWLPVIWLWIIGSRPVSAWLAIWFGIGAGAADGLDAQLDGSPADAFVFLGLLAVGMVVLIRRKDRTLRALRSSGPLLLYLSYCLISCSWSAFPDVAFKRWTKNLGDLAMVLIVATDPEPIAALRRVFSRVGVVLFSASILMVRYTTLGYAYDPGGAPMFIGVNTNKNTLGLITYVISIGAVWSFLVVLRTERSRQRSRQLLATGILVASGIVVLHEARSATSIACFILGTGLILTSNLSFIRRRPERIHALMLTAVLVGCIALFFGGESTVAGALGRDGNTLGDRTKIWAAVIPVCPNAIIGAGFESFWNRYGRYVIGDLSIYEQGLNSAHNGYIEVWINLGWIGVSLIAVLLFSGYQRACAAFQRNPLVGRLMLAYVATVAMYGITEAGYRIMTPSMISLFLVLAGSRSIMSGESGQIKMPLSSQSSGDLGTALNNEWYGLPVIHPGDRIEGLR